MKAVQFHDYGGPDVVRYEDAPEPTPGPGEVRIRVAGSAVNPVDDGIRGGYLQQQFPVAFPHIPDSDVSGTVDALGEGVDRFAVGDAVVGFLPMQANGGAAQFALAPVDVLVAAPASIPLADASALPSVALTARQALFDDAGLVAGQRVLVNGAGGAVGNYAVQLAKRAGAHVIATSSPRTREQVAAAGADEIVDHTAGPISVDPVDVVLNLARVDDDTLGHLLGLVTSGGVFANTVPTLTVPDPGRDVRVAGVFVRSDAAQLADLVNMVDRGELRVLVNERIPLSDLPAVHTRLADGEPVGKIVVLPPN